MRCSPRLICSPLASFGMAALLALAAGAEEGRRVIMPGSAPPTAVPSAKVRGDDDVDLVGPTESQKKRAQAAAEAKARVEEAARGKLEAEAKAKSEAEARAKLEGERRLREAAEAKERLEAEAQARTAAARKLEEERQARLEAERKQRLDAEAAEQARSEAEKLARAESERLAREQGELKSRADAKARAEAEAEASLRAEIEQRVRSQVEAELRAEKEKEARRNARLAAKVKAEADRKSKAEARAKAKGLAKAQREARKKGKKARTDEALPLPELPAQKPLSAELAALKAPERVVPLASPAAGGTEPASYRPPGTQLAMVAPAPLTGASASAERASAPGGQQGQRRQIEVDDALQIGPQSLVINRLTAAADLAPGALPVRGTFAYRLAVDEASALHHYFFLGAESARDADGRDPALRWSALAGLSPNAANTYGAVHSANGKLNNTADNLGWSSFALAGSLGHSFAREDGTLYGLLADAQLQDLSVQYRPGARPGVQAVILNTGLDQLRLRAAGTASSGRLEGLLQLGVYLHVGGSTDSLRGVPLRGALLEDDLGGLAMAPQSISARLGGTVHLLQQLSASLSYTYLGYSSADWSAGHLIHADLSDRFGRLRASLGFTWQYDAPVVTAPGSGVADYSTLFLTGSIGYAF